MKRFCGRTLALAGLAVLAFAAQPAAAQCTQFLCYVDLGAGGGFICPAPGGIYAVSQVQTVPDSAATTCDDDRFQSALVTINVPTACRGVAVWLEYDGQPEGWTVNIGDSATNDGFGGDAGSLPNGQNAEVQILDENLSLYSNALNPPLDRLAFQHLALTDGSVKFVVRNQFLSWGQPHSAFESLALEKLFVLPAAPAAGENRTLYVGLNRSIGNPGRNGCGARRAVFILQP